MKALRIIRAFAWAAVAVLVAVVAAIVWLPRSEEAVTTTAAIGGPFELVDGSGQPFTDRQLAGKPFAVFFGFTHCPDVCPTTLGEMALLKQKLGPDGDRLNVLFVSVDPERDTPELVGQYVSAFDPGFVGLTGSEAQVDAMVKAYRVYRRKVPLDGGDYTMDHTASVFLMGPDGAFRGTLDNKESEEMQLTKLRRLVGA